MTGARRTYGRTLRRGLAALAVGATLVVGVPVALVVLAGNPLPSALPTAAGLSRALTNGEIAEQTLVKALACVCWLAWSQLVVALAVEAVAAWRGRLAPRVPTAAAFHGIAAAIVAAAVPLLSGPGGGRTSDPPPLPESLVTDPSVTPPAPWEAQAHVEPTEPVEAVPVPPPPAGARRHRVARRETLWGIAATRLGDPYRWREVFELNRGRAQEDGTRLERPDQPLRAGWTLALPADATPGPATEVVPPPPGGDLLEATRDAHALAEAAEAERRSALADLADLAATADIGVGPATGDLAAVDLAAVDLDAVDLAAVEDAVVGDGPVNPGSVLARLAGAGLLAGGVLWTLDRLRRATERRRLPGTPVAAPEPAAERLEMGLRAAARRDLVGAVDVALRVWASRLADAGRRPPRVVGVNVADELSLLFATPDRSPVEGFEAEDDGFSWVTADWDALESASEGAAAAVPVPCLFTLGSTDRSQVLLNVEALDVVAVTGAGTHLAETMFSIATELATGPWGTRARVVTIGFGRELASLTSVKVAPTLADVVADLEATAARAKAACAEHDVTGALDARLRGLNGDVWTPTVVLAAGLDAAGAEQLAALATSTVGAGVCALIAGHVASASWCIEVTENEVTLDPVGVTLRRNRLADDVRPALQRLLEDPVPTPDRARRLRATPATGVDPDDEPLVAVGVVGPVEVSGAATDFGRRKALELVAYLALHRRGADSDTLAEALWPDRLTSPRTLHGVVSLARRALGTDTDGAHLLPHAGADGLYRLSSRIGLDLERFGALVARSAEAPLEAAIDDLERALRLVRGRPFTVAGDEYLWAHAEALVTAVVAEVTDAAHRLACLYLDAHDSRGAWWATQQGLLVSPGNEQLYRDRMLAADAAGNPAGVEEVMGELCRAVEIERSEMHDVLHPMTIELYGRLARRPAARALVSPS